MLTLPYPSSALPPTHFKHHGPYRPFGENQLSPSSVGILPLTVSHPMSLQRQRVRASPQLSPGFTLLAVSSPGFGSATHTYSPFKTRFPYAFEDYLVDFWCVRQLAGSFFNRHEITVQARLSRFVRRKFQVLFHWAFRPSFRLSLTVLVHYRSLTLFSLGGWFPQIPTGYVPHGTWDTPRGNLDLTYRAFTFFGQLFRVVLLSKLLPYRSPATPHKALAGKVEFRLLRFRSPLLTQSH